MRRKALLGMLAIGVAGLLVVVLLRVLGITSGITSSGREIALQKYIRYRLGATATWPEIVFQERANRPWEFISELRGLTFGDSMFYQVNVAYTGQNGPRPLPFPPTEIWCIQLRLSGEVGAGQKVDRYLFVARHQDLYNADWVTYEPPGDLTQSPTAVFAKIGCRGEP